MLWMNCAGHLGDGDGDKIQDSRAQRTGLSFLRHVWRDSVVSRSTCVTRWSLPCAVWADRCAVDGRAGARKHWLEPMGSAGDK